MLECIEHTVQGFNAITIRNAYLSCTVVPELGGKITSLKAMQIQREWLALDEQAGLNKANYADDFRRFDSGGWDECFPSIAPEVDFPIAKRKINIPDHGQLWCLPWQVVELKTSKSAIIVVLRCEGVGLGYRFTRSLKLGKFAKGLIVDYQLVNHSDESIPYIWSMHPIFAVTPNMHITLPARAIEFATDIGFKTFFNTQVKHFSWPYQSSQNHHLNLSHVMPYYSGFASKMYSDRLKTYFTETDSFEVKLSCGDEYCGFRFSPHQVSHLGLWFNYHGWSGNDLPAPFVLGIEPCIGNADSLRQSIENKEASTLLAHEQRSWQVEFFIS
ncbi:hypothetical protein B5G52_21135 [Pseudoalteromonas sp. A601]|uniref:hypothetical protein n=1 Tax=Pseudoalteromonas sp. A601 TaxID=1967839 RepID=UPI000B3C3BF1|nr:hypothetical protein [Pseudoalteromonas sp. A601]OUS67856.1 hypothetical protein B5G52_21135 [Pseudoalteromonas sp. A601]